MVLINPQFLFCKTPNQILCYADSLIKEDKYKEVSEFLLPLEYVFEKETDINKYHFYSLLSRCFLQQNNYEVAIPFVEKRSEYNHIIIYDYYFLANYFSTVNPQLDKAEYYSRKALLLADEIMRLNRSKEHTDSQIGRLLYFLGVLSSRVGNEIMTEEYYNCILNNNYPIDQDLKDHLIECLNDNHSSNDSTLLIAPRIKFFELLKESLVYKDTVFSVNFDNIYEDLDESHLKSIVNQSDFNVSRYLHTVFHIEDKYELPNISNAIVLLREACEVVNSMGGTFESTLELCELYMRLGRADYYLKQYDSAIVWFLLSYNSSRKLNNGIYYNIQALGEIADIYIEKGEKFKSILYADEMFEELVKLNAKDGIDKKIFSYLSRYANILSNTGCGLLAEELYKMIIERSPKQSQAYRLACNNYATYLFLNNRRDEGCYYYFLIKDAFPTPQTISNLSMAYLICNKIPEAEEAFHEYYGHNLSQLETVLRNFTEPEWNRFWDKYGYDFYITSNFLASKINTKESLVEGYNASVLSKNLPLSYKINIGLLWSSSEDTRIQKLYTQYVTSKQILSKGSINSYNDKITTSDIKLLEDSLLRKINISNNEIRFIISDYDKVLSSLAKDEVAIEFCEYIDVLSHLDSISSKYAAYIIDPECDSPIFVILGDEIEIYNYIFNSQKDEISLNQLYTQNKIGELIWSKILPYLENKRKIYFSPIGELSLLNHQLLQCSQGVLGEMYDVRRVSSTSLLPEIKENHTTFSTAVLYGDINYDTDYEDMKTASAQYNYNGKDFFLSLRGDEDREGWHNLQFSRQEIDSINTVLMKRGCSSSLYYGNNANEESFKALDFQAPSIIHIATHGFTFFRNDEEEKRNKITSLSPYTSESVLMSWAGLLFSGANNTWTGKYQIRDFEDGILTANEISLLHLDGAELVVLSACNTGLGINDMYGSTIGLQKAFKLAGAKSILMSLWKVPDESTALLMTKFYESLFSGKNRHEALKIAMKKVSEIYPDPYYWGAFVILD